jgi:hypothetical protein
LGRINSARMARETQSLTRRTALLEGAYKWICYSSTPWPQEEGTQHHETLEEEEVTVVWGTWRLAVT